jgi:hypothetical protein
VGFFAVAGPDLQRLVKPDHLLGGTRSTDVTEAARRVVEARASPHPPHRLYPAYTPSS